MKKINLLFILLICVCLVFGLMACDEDNNENENLDAQDNTVYTITCEESDFYTFGGTVSSISGNTAIVKLTSNYDAYEIIGCTYNGESCVKTSADDAEQQEFNFTMPKCNVEIKVLYRWKDLSVAGNNNFLSFAKDNTYNTSSAKGDSTYNNDLYYGTPLVLSFESSALYVSIAKTNCFSSNQSIIPDDAIEVNLKTSSSGNFIDGGTIIVDRSKLNVGTAQIVLKFKSDNNNAYDAIIVATITVE